MDRAIGRRAALGAILGAGAMALAPRAWAQAASVEARPARALLARWPRMSLPWRDLGGLPTPISRVVRGGPIWIKRDDQAGEGYGGSKARKLELLLAAAMAGGHARVLTMGSAGSNHALATAFHARRAGLACALVLLPEPASDHVRAHLLAAAGLGAELYAGTRADLRDLDGALARLAPGPRPFVVPQGGTSARGNIGYVEAALELAAQIEGGLAPRPARIYVAAGTSGAAAGLYVGLRAVGSRAELRVVRTSSRQSVNAARLRGEIEATAALLRSLDRSFPLIAIDGGLQIEERAIGPGYARPSRAGARAAAIAGELGVMLDSTYTAKAFAALLRDRPRVRGEVLFWNTFDPRPIATDATVVDLPPALRRYFTAR